MSRITTIEIDKQDIKFSAAHFTIFSSAERERLHGHNFSVSLAVDAGVGDDGLCFSYHLLKDRLRKVCHDLDEYTLLPALSPHMSVEEIDDQYIACHNGQNIPFLVSDTLVLPVCNTTVEELSNYLLNLLLEDRDFIVGNQLQRMRVGVSSGPGQTGYSQWVADE